MEELTKFLWRWFKSIMLRKKNVRISPFAHFNQKTVFEGNNVIYKGASVNSSIIGRNTYIGANSGLTNCLIGRFCSIASDVLVVSATHPSSVFVSTSPSFFSTLKQNGQTFVKKNKFEETLKLNDYRVVIGNDVWIGTKVIIKGGVTIGDGAIVAMGSIVAKDVPPYTIVGGVPAKVIKSRFTEEQISKLKEISWWNLSEEWLQIHADEFENIDLFLEKNKM